jgi:hypothetical protein
MGVKLDKSYVLNNIDKKMDKDDIFMIFYINIDGLTKIQSEQNMQMFINNHKLTSTNSYNITQFWFPVINQDTRVEIINPKLINGDIIKSFKNLVDTLDNNKYRDLVNNL